MIHKSPASTMTGRSLLQRAVHRLVGAHGATNIYPDQYENAHKKFSNFGRIYQDNLEITKNKVVFLGEIHSNPTITSFQAEIQAEMSKSTSKLHVIMEHFSFEMQQLLDDFQNQLVDFDGLLEQYDDGAENHNLEPYRGLLEYAVENREKIKLHAGFLPRSYAKLLMKEGESKALEKAAPWLPRSVDLNGSDFHYNVFEGLISGRPLTEPPNSRFRGIFRAQILKDVAMANRIFELIQQAGDDEKFLVIAGNGHLMHYCGVPERVFKYKPEIADQSCLVLCQSSEALIEDDETVRNDLKSRFGAEGSNPADFVYMFREEMGDVKLETKLAYDKVGESAHLVGNSAKAAAVMHALGYTKEQFETAGPDACNFQGVGNPHVHAKIQPGETVLDVGSGLGVDSFIASKATGPKGRVIGLDISGKEVNHAQARSDDRGLGIQFLVADMEDIPLPDDSVDVVISNGAFCLAPNKEKAFAEIYRVLRPGGRISICTSTIQSENLEPGVSWPLCMQMFVPKSDLGPLCKRLGYVDVEIDDSDSSMTFELPEEVLAESNPNRNRVHVGSEEFRHLEQYDMDTICARVCVAARKPLPRP